MADVQPTPTPERQSREQEGLDRFGRCQLIDLPVISDPRGSLTAIEGGTHVPFAIERVYYTYEIPNGAVRGGHAHRRCEVFMIAMSGSFEVSVHDGKVKDRLVLDGAQRGLYIPTMVWREITNFSKGAVCMVLASAHYLESDYIRDFDQFLKDAET